MMGYFWMFYERIYEWWIQAIFIIIIITISNSLKMYHVFFMKPLGTPCCIFSLLLYILCILFVYFLFLFVFYCCNYFWFINIYILQFLIPCVYRSGCTFFFSKIDVNIQTQISSISYTNTQNIRTNCAVPLVNICVEVGFVSPNIWFSVPSMFGKICYLSTRSYVHKTMALRIHKMVRLNLECFEKVIYSRIFSLFFTTQMCFNLLLSDDVRCFLERLWRSDVFSTADHENTGLVIVLVVVVGPAKPVAEAAQEQLLHLRFETLAGHVVNHGIVHRGALGKHAGQEADFRRDATAVFQDRPQAYHAIRGPTPQEADTDQNSNLQRRREEKTQQNPFWYDGEKPQFLNLWHWISSQLSSGDHHD